MISGQAYLWFVNSKGFQQLQVVEFTEDQSIRTILENLKGKVLDFVEFDDDLIVRNTYGERMNLDGHFESGHQFYVHFLNDSASIKSVAEENDILKTAIDGSVAESEDEDIKTAIESDNESSKQTAKEKDKAQSTSTSVVKSNQVSSLELIFENSFIGILIILNLIVLSVLFVWNTIKNNNKLKLLIFVAFLIILSIFVGLFVEPNPVVNLHFRKVVK